MSKSSDWDIDRQNHEQERAMKVYTIGYSGWKPDDLEKAVRDLDAVLVDVRMVPRTRWAPAFNTSALRERMGDGYIWLKAFGNVNYKGTFAEIQIADFDAGEKRLRELTASGRPVVLLCGCRDVNVCHRKVIAERLAALWQAEVVHLERPAPAPAVGPPGLF